MGTSGSASGYGISSEEFSSLLGDSTARHRVIDLLQREGVALDPDDPDGVSRAYRATQADSRLQRATYQIAMDTWR